MKKALLLLALFFTAVCSAQFELEHTYNDGAVTRVNFETWGEKYYLFKTATNELVFYNADHSFWKTVVLPASAPGMFWRTNLFHISETEINPDSNIEIVFGHYNHTEAYYECKVIDDQGNVLLTVPNAYSLNVDKHPGLPNKLISRNTTPVPISKVYSLPGLSLENTYINGEINRIKLENSGEKYYVLDKSIGLASVYNTDHTLWKTINMPKPVDATFSQQGINFISENRINTDASLEIGYTYYSGSGSSYTYEGKIINESNDVLLTLPNVSDMRIDIIDGMADKLISSVVHYDSSIGQYYTSDVYGLPGLAMEKQYDMEMARVDLENSGEKYYGFRNLISGHTKIYNADHSLWKTVYLDVPFDGMVKVSVAFISETKISNDALLEIGYVYMYYSPLMYTVFHGKVINEDGLVYLDSPDVQSYVLSEFSNLPAKLVAVRNLSDPFDETIMNYQSDVYSVDAAMATAGFEKTETISLAPNPSASVVNIDSANTITRAVVFDVLGAKVLDYQSNGITAVNVSDLKTGIYFLTLSDSSNKKSTHKIVVSH